MYSLLQSFKTLEWDVVCNLTLCRQDLPKLDGLACSFLLAPSDSFKYASLYSSVLSILHVIHQCEFHNVHKDKRDYSALCAMQYCFSAGWRLVLCLPPSISVMDNLSTLQVRPLRPFLWLFQSVTLWLWNSIHHFRFDRKRIKRRCCTRCCGVLDRLIRSTTLG